MKTGIELITEERAEQLGKHGWNLEHDSQHKDGILAKIAATLVVMHTDAKVSDPDKFSGSNDNPWGLEKKLSGQLLHRLKVAGALIAAEIDRINNLNKTT